MARPPTTSSKPPTPACERSGTGSPGKELGGQAMSFMVPAQMKTTAETMRRTASARAGQGAEAGW